MACRDPALIITLCAGRDSWTVCTFDRNCLAGVDRLAAEGSLGTRAILTRNAGSRLLITEARTLLSLGEECCEPGVVDEVSCTCKGCAQDEVKEDA